MDDRAFICESREDIKQAAQIIQTCFTQFGLQKHVGTLNLISKTEAMYFPAFLSAANNSKTLPHDIILNESKNIIIPFINNFRYLGAYITLDLNKNTKV